MGVETRTFQLPGDELDSSLDGPRTLVLAFGHPDLAPDAPAVEALRVAYPTSVLVGCSSAGHVLDDLIFDDGLTGIVARFDHTDLRRAVTTVTGADDSADAGRRLGRQLSADGLAAVLVLSDGVLVNGSDLARGLNAVLPAGVPVSGGLAGDSARFTRTWVLSGAQLGPGLVAAVGLYGDHIRLGYGSHGGWERFGPARRVTRSDGNKLYELDGKPALELYKSYLGVYADGLPGTALRFPLAVHSPDRVGHVVRTILSVDEGEQSMTFAGDLPLGSTAQLMRATHDMLIDGAMSAAQACAVSAADRASGHGMAVAVSCVGRRLVLGERAEEELEAVRGVLGRMPLVGFYSNGELSPGEGYAELHNQTMTLAVLVED